MTCFLHTSGNVQCVFFFCLIVDGVPRVGGGRGEGGGVEGAAWQSINNQLVLAYLPPVGNFKPT